MRHPKLVCFVSGRDPGGLWEASYLQISFKTLSGGLFSARSPERLLYFENIKTVLDSKQKTALQTRFWNLFEHNWPLIGPLDLSQKRNILTFEGASRGIGQKIQKSHHWRERSKIIWPKWGFSEEIKTKKRWFGQWIKSRWLGSGPYSARIAPTGSGKPMETLPGPKKP